MKEKFFFLLISSFLFIYSCTKNQDDDTLDAKTALLVSALEQELKPLTVNPMSWNDDQLIILNSIADNAIIALGEATHGTAEFFTAKHRILKYLVENHNYKVFAIEADFGESILINEAVQRGSISEIENLMKTKMHFWTWRTKEVRDLITWMCEYNLGKQDKDKIQYMGVDCQFNTYHPRMVMDYLERVNPGLSSYAENILDEAQTATEDDFNSYTTETFNQYLDQIDILQDSMTMLKNDLVTASSEKEYQLFLRILKVIRQVSEVRYYRSTNTSINYRDQYMAENTAWLYEYFDEQKIVLWAHNGHIADNPSWPSMGNYIKQIFDYGYITIGFLFSKGSFTAIEYNLNTYTGLKELEIDTDPKKNSLNAIMSYVEAPAFIVQISNLQKYQEWNDAFNNNLQYFDIGSVFNNNPMDYYKVFNPDLFHYIIYFDTTTASVLL